MEKLYKRYCIALVVFCVAFGMTGGTVLAATLSASTSLTVVHVTEFLGATADVTRYTGAWPDSHDSHPTNPDNPFETYLSSVNIGHHAITWSTNPGSTPYAPFSNGINSMIAAIWSEDQGKTFKLISWDYLLPHSNQKALHEGMPNCWMGTMIHSLCDRKGGECNGRYRTNLRFTEYPAGASGCWGSAVMR